MSNIDLNETIVEVDIQDMKKSFFRPYIYHGTVSVTERCGDNTEVQTADFQYDSIDKTIEFDNYSLRTHPRHNRLGELPGVVDCYPDAIARRIEEELQAQSKLKNKGIEL